MSVKQGMVFRSSCLDDCVKLSPVELTASAGYTYDTRCSAFFDNLVVVKVASNVRITRMGRKTHLSGTKGT